MKEIEIFTKSNCGWAERLYAALDEKNIAYRIVPSCDRDGRKTREFLSLSPYARTPTLRYGELVLGESALIVEFLDEQFPEHPLRPCDPGERARDRFWIYHCDHVLIPALSRSLSAQGEAGPEVQASLTRALGQILQWGFRRGGPAPYWDGEAIGLVDLAYHTFFQAVEYVRGMKDGPQIAIDGVIDAWRLAIAGHPSVRKAREVALAIPFADESETR